MNRINWTQVAVFAVVVMLVFAVGMGVLSSLWGGYGGYGMMGLGMMGGNRGYGPSGMMGGYGGGLFGWLFMLLMCLFPLGFLALPFAAFLLRPAPASWRADAYCSGWSGPSPWRWWCWPISPCEGRWTLL